MGNYTVSPEAREDLDTLFADDRMGLQGPRKQASRGRAAPSERQSNCPGSRQEAFWALGHDKALPIQ